MLRVGFYQNPDGADSSSFPKIFEFEVSTDTAPADDIVAIPWTGPNIQPGVLVIIHGSSAGGNSSIHKYTTGSVPLLNANGTDDDPLTERRDGLSIRLNTHMYY